ncbi:MAG: hypothetical protein V4819_06875 [Verrucomicrobiota bacterium]
MRRENIPALTGGFIVGICWLVYSLNTRHHYREIGTFFRGTIADKKVIAVSYFEYYGMGFLELNKWRVDLIGAQGDRVTIYQKQASFQEPVPHQPKIEIGDNQILIDDGESRIAVRPQTKTLAEPNVTSDQH